MAIQVTSTTRTAEEMAQTFGLAAPEPSTPPSPDTPGAPDGEAAKTGTTPPVPGQEASVDAPKTGEPQPPAADEPRRVSRAQQRVNDALRDKKIAELAAAEKDRVIADERQAREKLAAELEKLKPATPPAPTPPGDTPPKADADPEPKEADYQDWQEYQRALSRWDGRQEARRILAEEHAKSEAVAAQARQRVETFEHAKAYNARAAEAQKKYADFDATVNQDIALNPIVGGIVFRSDVGPDLAYHFGKNPAEAARISALPADAMLTEMYRLEGRFMAQRDATKPAAATPPPPSPRLPSAPPPPASLPAGAVVNLPTTRTARTIEEFRAAEKREQAARPQR